MVLKTETFVDDVLKSFEDIELRSHRIELNGKRW